MTQQQPYSPGTLVTFKQGRLHGKWHGLVIDSVFFKNKTAVLNKIKTADNWQANGDYINILIENEEYGIKPDINWLYLVFGVSFLSFSSNVRVEENYEHCFGQEIFLFRDSGIVAINS